MPALNRTGKPSLIYHCLEALFQLFKDVREMAGGTPDGGRTVSFLDASTLDKPVHPTAA